MPGDRERRLFDGTALFGRFSVVPRLRSGCSRCASSRSARPPSGAAQTLGSSASGSARASTSWSSPSMMTGDPNGSCAIPPTACGHNADSSPNTAIITSVNPSITGVWATKPGAELTMPSTRTHDATRSRSPSSRWRSPSTPSAVERAAAYPCSTVRSAPSWPPGPAGVASSCVDHVPRCQLVSRRRAPGATACAPRRAGPSPRAARGPSRRAWSRSASVLCARDGGAVPRRDWPYHAPNDRRTANAAHPDPPTEPSRPTTHHRTPSFHAPASRHNGIPAGAQRVPSVGGSLAGGTA